MIELTEDLFLGKGRHKITYLHPEDKTKCIKVQYDKRPTMLKDIKKSCKK